MRELLWVYASNDAHAGHCPARTRTLGPHGTAGVDGSGPNEIRIHVTGTRSRRATGAVACDRRSPGLYRVVLHRPRLRSLRSYVRTAAQRTLRNRARAHRKSHGSTPATPGHRCRQRRAHRLARLTARSSQRPPVTTRPRRSTSAARADAGTPPQHVEATTSGLGNDSRSRPHERSDPEQACICGVG